MTVTRAVPQATSARVDCLDGLRGLAALWVLLGHAMLLTGFRVPVISQPDLGVDLFILLSGFLMVFQYNQRRDREDWSRPGTWLVFWTRRFFRLAPLFYVLLALALLLGPVIYDSRVMIDTFLHNPLQAPERYLDSSLTNVLAHVSFAFGVLPDYAFRTPLPDWSLGLEMQFYLVFPFLVLIARRIGWAGMAIVVAAIGFLIAWATMRAGIVYPMPSFLPLKLHLFLSGMLISAALGQEPRRMALYLAMALAFGLVPLGGSHTIAHVIIREAIIFGFFALVHLQRVGLVERVGKLFGGWAMRWLGELSYGAYLIHLVIMQPVAGWTIRTWGADISPMARFGLVATIVLIATYGMAFITYKLVEKPGIAFGRNLIARRGAQRAKLA